jgi:VanZ family protein
MVLIFGLSSMPSDDVDRGLLYVIARKLAHFSEYALLTALWARALAGRLTHGRALAGAVAIAVAYSITDEYHQTFVEGRVGAVTDVLIDTAGALFAAALISYARRRETLRA